MRRSQPLTTTTRLFAAGLVLAGGLIHLNLWLEGYRQIPVIGPLFLANALASAIVAVLLAITVSRPAISLGLALSVGSLVALAMSRSVGLFGHMEGWNSDSLRTLAAEVGATVAIATAFVARRSPALIPLRVRSGPASDRSG